MENFSTLIENSKRAVRYWWLLLIIGIALFVVGILVFVYPTQSYLGMSLLFGWLMLISGILEVVLSSVNKHFITGRGWMLAGGIIEIVLGIILIFNVALSAATLPIFLGFWLMLRGVSAIGLGGDMNAIRNSLRPSAQAAVRTNVLLDAVAAAENIEVSEEECEEEYKKLAESYKMELDDVKKALNADGLKSDLKLRKAARLIADSAVAVAPKAPEAAEEAPASEE